MARRDEFLVFRLKGLDSPAALSIPQLVELLRSLEASVRNLVAVKHPAITAESLTVALTRVGKGSAALGFSCNYREAASDAAVELSQAIKKADFTTLPPRVAEPLAEVVDFVKKRRLEATVLAHEGKRPVRAAITADYTPRMASVAPSVIEGETTLYAVVERVGGAKPAVVLRVSDDEKVTCQVSEEQAQEMARYLYHFVGVSGVATWNVPGFTLETFRITHVTDYEDARPSTAIEELASVLGPFWKDTKDVVAEIERLRHGEDTE